MDASPNIEALSEHVHGVGTELRRLQNLPAFDNGIMILQQLQQLQQNQHQHYQQQQQQMEQMQQHMEHMQQHQMQMQQQLNRLSNAVGRLETTVTGIAQNSDIRDSNSLARFENYQVSRGDHELVLPTSFDTGTTIINCPNTADEILRLSSDRVNQVLTQLRLPTSGRVSERTRRLLKYMGVTVQAI